MARPSRRLEGDRRQGRTQAVAGTEGRVSGGTQGRRVTFWLGGASAGFAGDAVAGERVRGRGWAQANRPCPSGPCALSPCFDPLASCSGSAGSRAAAGALATWARRRPRLLPTPAWVRELETSFPARLGSHPVSSQPPCLSGPWEETAGVWGYGGCREKPIPARGGYPPVVSDSKALSWLNWCLSHCSAEQLKAPY